MASELGAKRLGILQELVPRATHIALLVNRTNPVSAESVIKDVERAASATARQIEVLTGTPVVKLKWRLLHSCRSEPKHLLSELTRFSSTAAYS